MTNPWLFRDTARSSGRSISITPDTSEFKAISAGRIILNDSVRTVSASNPRSETTLLCLHGSARVHSDGTTYDLSRFDGIYIARGAEFRIETDSFADIVEGSAPTENTHPTQYVSFAADVADNEALTLNVGVEPYHRKIHKVIAENVKGSRILMGVTMSAPGNWTSWPPHEHAATREELYLFFDIPRPGFATQFIYTNPEEPELVMPVYEDDAVTIVKGYHPNVASPGYPVNFCWILCSLEDDTWRTLAGVNVQPGFEAMPTGLR